MRKDNSWRRIVRAVRVVLLCCTVVPCCAEGTHDAGPGKISRPMFDEEFYPTPEPVIARMLEPWLDQDGKYNALRDMKILDPSAGSGAILKHIMERHAYAYPELHAVEINPTCRTLLEAIKGVRLEHDDFLKYTPETSFDLIVMNPPFSNGAKHVLHAWEIMERGDIVALLNAETLRNLNSWSRKQLAKLVEENGSVEYIGQVFSDAERKTDVEVALVRLAKVSEADPFAFWHDAYFQRERVDYTIDEDTLNSNTPAVNDLVGAMVHQFQQVQTVFIEYLKSMRRLKFHAGPVIENTNKSIETILEESISWKSDPKEINKRFTELLTEQAWMSVVARTKLQDLMTEGVRKDFQQLQDGQGKMAFTKENIHGLFELLFMNQHKILKRSIDESFDLMTRYHKENRVHMEGWLSNDAFKVSRKVVLPSCIEQGYSRSFSVQHYRRNTLLDIDRGIGVIVGKKLRQLNTIVGALERKFNTLDGVPGGALDDNVCKSEFFHIRFFKKGTIHLTWLDENLWDRFNIAAAQGKNWLPMDYGRKGEENAAAPRDKPAADRAAQLLLEA